MITYTNILTKDFLKNCIAKQMSQSKIAESIGCSQAIISKFENRFLLKRNFNLNRWYDCKESYFDEWSSDMAYILGFITCDGYIRYINTNKKCLNVDINVKDEDVLKFILNQICPHYRLRYRQRLDKRTNKIYKSANISIMSKKIVESLERLDIVRNKTGKERFANVPPEFINDYLRGVFDGDGCLYIGENNPKGNGYKRFRLSICSASLDFLESINKYFNCGRILKGRTYSTWKCENSKQIYNILFQLYNGGFCLKRKYDKFLELSEYLQINK